MRCLAAILLAITTALIAVLFATITPAFAQAKALPPHQGLFSALCMDRAIALGVLEQQHQEIAIGGGTAGNTTDIIIETYINRVSGSFSILYTKGTTSCIVFGGQNWTDYKPKILGAEM